MKKFLDLSSWSRWSLSLSKGAVIGFMLIMAFAVVGCDDSSSASAGQNDEPGVESSSSSVTQQSSSSVRSSSSAPVEDLSSSSENAKSSSSDTQSDAKQSSSSEKSGKSSSSVNDVSSNSLNDFDWNLPKEAYLNPDIDYGTMTDERDGQVYKTVKIGDQTWMAENLNFDPGQGGSGDYKYRWSWCYDNKKKNCDVGGRLYTWAAAIDSVKLANDADNPQACGYEKICTLPVKVQGICPTGWHLPTNAEWSALFTAVGGQSTAGKVLKSQSGWKSYGNASDAVGFSALPAGNGYGPDDFYREGYSSFFWSSTEDNGYSAYQMDLCCNDEEAYLISDFKGNGFSVRCVKD